MKIFPERNKVADVQELLELTRSQLDGVFNSNRQELVAVKSRMGGYEMQLRDVPLGQEFMLVR